MDRHRMYSLRYDWQLRHCFFQKYGSRNCRLCTPRCLLLGSGTTGSSSSDTFELTYSSIQGNTFAMASEVVPRRYRGVAQVINNYGGNSGADISAEWRKSRDELKNPCRSGVLLGAIAGAALVQYNPGGYPGWRAIFWIAGGCAGAVAILIFFAYHPPPAPYSQAYDKTPVLQKVMSFDIVGACLLGAALVPLLMGLIWGGETYPYVFLPPFLLLLFLSPSLQC